MSALQATEMGPTEPVDDLYEVAPEEKGWIYFIETLDQQFIKIGYSKDPRRRLMQFGTSQPAKEGLRLIGCIPGDRRMEAWLHATFAEHRNNREWFKNSPALQMFLGVVNPVQPDRLPQPKRILSPKARGAMKNPAAVALGRLGGKAKVPKGLSMLPEEQRKQMARKGAKARWGKAKKAGKK